MTGVIAVLSIKIAESRWLSEIFGEEAARHALTNFGEEATGLLSRLLAQHEVIDRYRADADGHWSACFRILSDGLPRDGKDVVETLEQAGRNLIRERLIAVFGGGTGARITTDLSVFLSSPEVGEEDAKANWLQWTEDRLRSQSRRQVKDRAESSAGVKAILAERSIQTVLQPIVRIRDGAVMGFEELSRGPRGTFFERPDLLFDAAHAAGRLVEMELLCAELALERTKGKLPPGKFLTINLGPDALAPASDKLALAGRQEILFELTEHLPLNEAEGLIDAVGRLRAMGIRLALDDTGCGFVDFGTVGLLNPEIVKLCITVIRTADKGASFAAAIRGSAERLCELGCQVLAEGVETTTQHGAFGTWPR
ncbi:EAL domain-containing protein [Paraburkholderia elongata]|uniref:EAL domain-containing protein n=1 Tax=Paraburkholderia elongata TaxID=2675747 RepID=A0A972NWG4_9BURK|nr:EAL domain-containing protein [Paraburkholderia elongata]NPT59723.1 EAL domain-containing protein [Paraburkholderia elongata]